MATATRTLNPLHFEDLEPHRFEDMVRQLVYDFRQWTEIEAVGRGGMDEGIDIRATEAILDTDTVVEAADAGEEDTVQVDIADSRVWIFQCKREKAITPKKIRSIVKNDLGQQDAAPYAYVLVAACDFTKATRDAFRAEVAAFGVQEFYLWGKAEIEDMLVLPKNDYLLFAYFGISLQVRRRSIRTAVRANLTLKRKLIKVFGGFDKAYDEPILVRDPRNEDYPFIKDATIFSKAPAWEYWYFEDHHPYGILLQRSKYLAYVDWVTGQWDAMEEGNLAVPDYPRVYGDSREEWAERGDKVYYCRRYWYTNVPSEHRAYYKEVSLIPFEQIVAVDEMGDSVNRGVHLLVEYENNQNSPVTKYQPMIIPAEDTGEAFLLEDMDKRIKHFPPYDQIVASFNDVGEPG